MAIIQKTPALKTNNQPTMVGWLDVVGNRGVRRRQWEREKMMGGGGAQQSLSH
jgi:hypothetical protein